ncbi:MAG: alanyl-tRNA editing protein [Anaerolineae bacterium]|nr:alanyl-tRNA editing protein [Anaerolineae bacterium]
MTDLLYQTDSYLANFDAVVMAVDDENKGVILNRTAFYPGGGGQPADRGILTVNGVDYSVSRAKKMGNVMLHLLEGEHSLSAGMSVSGHIDWEYRYQLMRIHTAMHILCGVVWRDYGASVTGGDMEALRGRMDFEFETMRQELVKDIEEKINAEVTAAREVETAILPRERAFQVPDLIRTKINLLPDGIEQIRTVEIVGLDLQADGGTHVHNTAEVGRLRVVDYKSKGKINKRIYLEVEA